MNVSKAEFLSAVLDDAAGDFERRRVLDELKHDDELLKTWGRYAVVGDIMRAKQPVTVINADFLAGIHAELEEDEVEVPPAVTSTVATSVVKKPVLWRSLLQYGVAAGLGAVVMVGWNTFNQPTVNTDRLASTNADPMVTYQSAVLTTPAAVSVAGEQYYVAASNKTARPINRLDPKTQALLKGYIKDHIRYASTTTVVPTVRAVSYNQ